MKVYVVGYREKEKQEEVKESRFSPTNMEVGYSKEPEWTIASEREAASECQILRGMNVHIGQHYCEFSVEELPQGGEFAIVCVSHPDSSMDKRETPIQHHSGLGKLIFEDDKATPVTYEIDEFFSAGSARNWRGQVSHVEGHPDWHPLTSLNKGPYTLVLSDGRKLKVTLTDPKGSIRGTGEFS